MRMRAGRTAIATDATESSRLRRPRRQFLLFPLPLRLLLPSLHMPSLSPDLLYLIRSRHRRLCLLQDPRRGRGRHPHPRPLWCWRWQRRLLPLPYPHLRRTEMSTLLRYSIVRVSFSRLLRRGSAGGQSRTHWRSGIFCLPRLLRLTVMARGRTRRRGRSRSRLIYPCMDRASRLCWLGLLRWLEELESVDLSESDVVGE
jgi:hypothetical protein